MTFAVDILSHVRHEYNDFASAPHAFILSTFLLFPLPLFRPVIQTISDVAIYLRRHDQHRFPQHR